MPFTFSSMNNQATVPITTANSNTLVALDSPSTINMTVRSSASTMVSITPALAISVAPQDKI